MASIVRLTRRDMLEEWSMDAKSGNESENAQNHCGGGGDPPPPPSPTANAQVREHENVGVVK